MVIPQNDLYTLAWEAEFGGHLFDIPILYTDPNAIDFNESYTQRPDTVFVTRSYLHDSSDGQNRETCSTSDPSVVLPSHPKSHGQSHDIETATDLCHSDSSKQTSGTSTDIETAYDSMQQSPSRQSDNPSTTEINNATTEIFPQNEPSHSRGGKYNLCRNPKPNYSEIYRH